MACLLPNIIHFTNVSQKMLQIELKIEKSHLKPGLCFRSADFNIVGKHAWFFELFLDRGNELDLWLRCRSLVDVNLSYTFMVFNGNKESLHGRMSSLSFKADPIINMLEGSPKYSISFFPLTVMIYIVIPHTDKEELLVENADQVISMPIQNIDKEETLGQNADKEIVLARNTNTAIEEAPNTNNYDNTPINCLQELSLNFKKLLDQAIGTDITMHVDGVSIKAHKMILRARSTVFDKMFDHDTSEAIENEIDIKDIRAPIMKEFLTFLYTGAKSNHDFNDACDLYYAADKYQVLSLRNACKKDLLNHLHVDNACQLLSFATNHGDESLKEDIMEFIKTNFKAIVATKSFEELAKYDANLVVLLMRNHMLAKSE